MEFGITQVDHQISGASQMYLALAQLMKRNPKEAERLALLAMESLSTMPPLLTQVSAVLAQALLGQGRVDEALVMAKRGLEELRRLGGVEEGETRIYVAAVECMRASGDIDGARVTLRECLDKLGERAARVHDEAVREKFLAYPDNARALELVRELA